MQIRSKLLKIYLKEEFNPKIIGLFLPGYFMAKEIYRNMLRLMPNLKGRLLDIGCGSKPHKDMLNVNEHIGIEIDDDGRQNHKYADPLSKYMDMPAYEVFFIIHCLSFHKVNMILSFVELFRSQIDCEHLEF